MNWVIYPLIALTLLAAPTPPPVEDDARIDLGNQALDEPLTTDRPTFAPSPEVLGVGRFQGEVGASYERRGAAESLAAGEVLVRLGIVGGWELRFDLGSYSVLEGLGGRRSGVRDFGFGLKKRLTSAHGRRPATAFVVAASVPTGSSAAGADGVEPSADFVAAWRLGRGLRLRAFVGFDHPDDEPSSLDRWSGGTTLVLFHGGRWRSFFELYGTSDDANGELSYLRIGALYRFYDFQIDFHLGAGTSGHDPEYRGGLGATIKW